MNQFRCKMCGGTIQINENMSTAVCEYCGTTQTLPKMQTEEKQRLFERANDYRRANEYDKAAALYEQLLLLDDSDAEIYWSLVLCRYGVEYVRDPHTREMLPTINRTQLTSVLLDKNYQKAIAKSDVRQRVIYRQEAEAIDDIQKGILNVSQNESPYDVFICYKETDSMGKRTRDSVLAQEMYRLLEKDGYKVFFARVTLKNKIGSAFEPYIFSALNSSKVMVVVGTSNENFESTWVKNEWSRFLAMMKNDKTKTLIPAYRDIGRLRSPSGILIFTSPKYEQFRLYAGFDRRYPPADPTRRT